MSKDLKELQKEVYNKGNGLNIYALKAKFQKEMMYPMPDFVVQILCEEYLKYKPTIKNDWAWAAKVLALKRDEAYVNSQMEKEKLYKDKVNSTLLKNIFAGEK